MMMDDEVMIKLPGGYKFSPFDEELLEYYLKPKVYHQKLPCNIVKEKEIYGPNANPWHVFNDSSTSWIVSSGKSSEKTVYVFTRLKKMKEKSSPMGKGRYVKKAGCGTWHCETGPEEIMDRKGANVIGNKKLLVYQINDIGDLGYGINLDQVGYWKMHEYSLCGFEEYVLCKITWDTSKKAKVASLYPKPVSSSSTKPKAQSKFAIPLTDSEEAVGMKDQRLSSEHYSEISEFGLVHNNYSVEEEGRENYGLVNYAKRFDEGINMMDIDCNLHVSKGCLNGTVDGAGLENQGNQNMSLVKCDDGGNHIVEEQGYDQVFDDTVCGTEEALVSTFSDGVELDGLLDIEEDLILDFSEEQLEELINSLSAKDMEMFNNQPQEFLPTSLHDNNNDKQNPTQNYSGQVLGKRKSSEAEQLGKRLRI